MERDDALSDILETITDPTRTLVDTLDELKGLHDLTPTAIVQQLDSPEGTRQLGAIERIAALKQHFAEADARLAATQRLAELARFPVDYGEPDADTRYTDRAAETARKAAAAILRNAHSKTVRRDERAPLVREGPIETAPDPRLTTGARQGN
ncbi:MAG: hypothetical protein AAFQ71_13090, partial [Planctomycetota bacterium]